MSTLFDKYNSPKPTVVCTACEWEGIGILTKLGTRYQESHKPYCPDCKSEKLKFLTGVDKNVGLLDRQAALLADARETGLNPTPIEEPKPESNPAPRKIGFTFAEMVENATKARKHEDSTVYERNTPVKPRGYKLGVVFSGDEMLELEFSSWGTLMHYLQSLPVGCEVDTMVAHQKGKVK